MTIKWQKKILKKKKICNRDHCSRARAFRSTRHEIAVCILAREFFKGKKLVFKYAALIKTVSIIYVSQRCFIWNLHVQSEHPRLPPCCSQGTSFRDLFIFLSCCVMRLMKLTPSQTSFRLCSTAGWTSLTLMWRNMSTTREQKMET